MKKIEISGMHCMHCVAAVEKALKNLGLQQVKVSLEGNCAEVEDGVADDKLKNAIEALGFDVVKISG